MISYLTNRSPTTPTKTHAFVISGHTVISLNALNARLVVPSETSF